MPANTETHTAPPPYYEDPPSYEEDPPSYEEDPPSYEDLQILQGLKDMLLFSLAHIFEDFREKEICLKQEMIHLLISEQKRYRIPPRIKMLQETHKEIESDRDGAETLTKMWERSGLSGTQRHHRDWRVWSAEARGFIEKYFNRADKACAYMGNSIYVLQHGEDKDLRKLAKAWDSPSRDYLHAETTRLYREVKHREHDPKKKTGRRRLVGL